MNYTYNAVPSFLDIGIRSITVPSSYLHLHALTLLQFPCGPLVEGRELVAVENVDCACVAMTVMHNRSIMVFIFIAIENTTVSKMIITIYFYIQYVKLSVDTLNYLLVSI